MYKSENFHTVLRNLQFKVFWNQVDVIQWNCYVSLIPPEGLFQSSSGVSQNPLCQLTKSPVRWWKDSGSLKHTWTDSIILWKTLPKAAAPDQNAHRITRLLKDLHQAQMIILGGCLHLPAGFHVRSDGVLSQSPVCWWDSAHDSGLLSSFSSLVTRFVYDFMNSCLTVCFFFFFWFNNVSLPATLWWLGIY